MAMATQFDRGLSEVAYSIFLCILDLSRGRVEAIFFIWNFLHWDNEMFSWWGGGNFFFSFEICHDEMTRCSHGGVGPIVFHLNFVTTRWWDVLGWVGAIFFFIWKLSQRDDEMFSWWVESTKSSIFKYIWVSLLHPPRGYYFVLCLVLTCHHETK